MQRYRISERQIKELIAKTDRNIDLNCHIKKIKRGATKYVFEVITDEKGEDWLWEETSEH